MNLLAVPGMWIGIVWLIWALSWMLAAGWSNATTVRPKLGRELPYRLLTLIGIALLFFHRRDTAAWHTVPSVGFLGLALVLAGVGFAWWARIHLGRLWSASVTGKTDHHVVDTGPYALVRHPIYTGLLLAVIGTALAQGTVAGALGAALIIVGTYVKARLEENFLREQLGLRAYDAYKARVPMLVPFTRTR
jgi:protein-S-isoprenylcysteine O-methyltransferase Ste14